MVQLILNPALNKIIRRSIPAQEIKVDSIRDLLLYIQYLITALQIMLSKPNYRSITNPATAGCKMYADAHGK